MDLESRVRQLEWQVRRRTRLGLAGLFVAGLAVCLGQARPQAPGEVRATRFVLVDDAGRQRATLGLEGGGPVLVLEDTSGYGVVRLQVPAVPDQAALYLTDPRASARAELAMTMNGPVFHFQDKTGTRVRLATNELNAPLAAIYDESGKPLLAVSAKNP